MLLESTRGSPQDRASIQLETRSGKYIENERRLERSYEALKAAERLWKGRFPRIQTRSLTAVYNCVGLAFASRRTCIEPYLVDWLLEEDGFRQVRLPEKIQPGDLVVYRKEQPEHVAMVIGFSTDSFGKRHVLAISQWGADGEYIHPVDDVPEEFFGKSVEYWTDRRKHDGS